MLLAIEGCLGVGKSTVAKGLSQFRGSATLFEAFEDNPFLRAFYQDPVGNAVETEFAFLLLHYHQLKAHSAQIANDEVISDFHLGKDPIYAALNLSNTQARSVFADLYKVCIEEVSTPALLIFLSATDELLIDRIRSRNRDFEQEIELDYYKSVNAAYQQFYQDYEGKKLFISMDQWDFVKAPELYGKLSKLVDEKLQSAD
jgi:deoxyguanosine kinase